MTKYDEKAAEKKYSECIKRNNGKVRIRSIVYLCRRYGMDTDVVRQRLIEKQKVLNRLTPNFATLHGGVTSSNIPSAEMEADESDICFNPDPETPLPTFGKLRLPYPLDLVYGRGQFTQQCDAMLLAALAVIGTAMD